MRQIIGYIVKNVNTGEWYNMDDRGAMASGYPYRTRVVGSAKIFKTRKSAESIACFPDENIEFLKVYPVYIEN